ncbi:MAG: hypothetical protein CMC13_10570 [Flavobacteriaceae bacterium]|nr:hypothetical protein [Flavobacteriaceae bacterium]
MKGKNQFSKSEFKQLKILIKEKQTADKTEQKSIRNRIRKIGFYFSDFSNKKKGYDISDLEQLVKTGQIKIVGLINNIEKPKIATKQKENSKQTEVNTFNKLNLTKVLVNFAKNRFEPNKDLENVIPDTCGNYIICLKKQSKLPKSEYKVELQSFDGLNVIYTGIAGKSLKKRDYRQHFKGNAGSSTLRKSLGVLFGYKLIPRDKNPESRKTKFDLKDESKLSDWMNLNLVMYFLPNSDFDDLENKLIDRLNPPLNLSKNKNLINESFRKNLSELRNNRNNNILKQRI